MSAYRGKPENICSGRGFRLLTPIGHFTKSANGDWDAFRRRAGAQAMMRAVNAAVIGQAIWGVTRTLHPDRERYWRGEAFCCQKKRDPSKFLEPEIAISHACSGAILGVSI
jgi:hypothetical protein